MQLTLLEKKLEQGDIYSFTFESDRPVVWKAGQHMVFTLEHPDPDNLGTHRIFTIATAPFEKHIKFLTHCSDQASTFKRALRQMEPGATLEATDPQGEFVMPDPAKHYTFVAAGVGISPFRAMLADLDYHNLPINVTLIYSNNSDQFLFKDEIEELLTRHPGFSVFYNVDPGQIERGRIKEQITSDGDEHIYMSGVYVQKIASMLAPAEQAPAPTDDRERLIADEDSYLHGFLGK